MRLFRALATAAVLIAPLAATPAALAQDGPAGLRGTLTITHTFRVKPVPGLTGVASTVTGHGFSATYHLHGGRWRARGAPPRSYLLTGHGHEDLDIHRTDLKTFDGGTVRLDMFGRAFGDVDLVRDPGGAGETGPLVLRLRPGGRFTLGLQPLLGGENGMRLNFELLRQDAAACESGGGTRAQRAVYNQGVYEVQPTEMCPDDPPFEGFRHGAQHQPTIWGGNVWAPPEAGFWQPDVCHGRIGRIPILTLCGRYGHGRIAGTKVVGGKRGYDTPGACAFFPRGNRGRVLPDPNKDALYEACSVMDLGGEWWRRTVVRWRFKPTH
jgi:hypothetical protein